MKRSLKIFIGHRGVGKSTFLLKLNSPGADLDQYIEQREKISLLDIFKTNGEQYFRELELKYFNELVGKASIEYISVGAGFKFIDKPKFSKIIWLRRESDALGRIFFDRPKLSNKDDLTEFLAKYQERENYYHSISDQIIDLGEGDFSIQQFEKDLLQENLKPVSGILTDSKYNRISEAFFKDLKCDYNEFRDDKSVHFDYKNKTLYSFRLKKASFEQKQSDLSDWALELGAPKVNTEIISLHDGDSTDFEPFSKGKHLKFAPMVSSFKDLIAGFRWQQNDPDNRSFLPRSNSGRWLWFRLFMKGKQKLNFFKIYDPEVADQPNFRQWYNHPDCSKEFAAVIGKDVRYSWSPDYHADFFLKNFNIPFYTISIYPEDFLEGFNFLKSIGLRFACITSPFKKEILQMDLKTNLAVRNLTSCNTIYLKDGQIYGELTDHMGLINSFKNDEIRGQSSVIWGGGGLKETLQSIFKDNIQISARVGSELTNYKVNNLVWAAGEKKIGPLPPESWKIERIIDLNYSEHSIARQIAKDRKIKYISGAEMFVQQALLQQEFWNKMEARNGSK